jgi:carbamoyltransferase
VTHVDGSARLQTVSAADNERYWRLIAEFGRLTGVPVLLNTSFNNAWEPIVDSVGDAIVCFLTTDLDYVVIGDAIGERLPFDEPRLLDLAIAKPPHIDLGRSALDGGDVVRREQPAYVRRDRPSVVEHPVSTTMARILANADGETSVAALLAQHGQASDETLARELADLWQRRLVTLRPIGTEKTPC